MLGYEVLHRCNPYLNNRLEQDHRGIKQRYYPMRGFGSFTSVSRFCGDRGPESVSGTVYPICDSRDRQKRRSQEMEVQGWLFQRLGLAEKKE
jgi:transposase-like protein